MVRRSQRYDDARVAVTEVVNAADPIALIAGGAPEDEYGPEVADLVRMVLRETPITEEGVNEVWVRYFSDDYDMSGTEGLAALTNDLRRLQARFAQR